MNTKLSHDPMPAAEHLGGGTLQQTHTDYQQAVSVQKKRVEKDVILAVRKEAAKAGERFFYSWSVKSQAALNGRQLVEGPTIKAANAIMRIYGNCAVDMKPLQETPAAYIFTAVFVDLETNSMMTRQYRQTKNNKNLGNYDRERAEDMLFQTGQSKAIRNVITNAVPDHIIQEALDAAKSKLREQLEGLIEHDGHDAIVSRCMKKLIQYGVSLERVCWKYMVENINGLTVDHLVCISADIKAIETGQESADALYPNPEVETKADEGLNEKQQSDMNRLRERFGGTAPPPPSEPSEPEESQDAEFDPIPEMEAGEQESDAGPEPPPSGPDEEIPF